MLGERGWPHAGPQTEFHYLVIIQLDLEQSCPCLRRRRQRSAWKRLREVALPHSAPLLHRQLPRHPQQQVAPRRCQRGKQPRQLSQIRRLIGNWQFTLLIKQIT